METGAFRFKFRTHPWIFVLFLLNFLWIPLKSQTGSTGFSDTLKRSGLNSDSLKLKIKEGVNDAVSITKDAIEVTKDALGTRLDSNRIVVAVGFNNHLDAVDTLTIWVFQKKYRKPVHGFLSQTQFVKLARSYDTLSPEVAIYAQYAQYKFQFEKELKWLRKYSRKYAINANNATVDPQKVILIRVNSVPPFKMARVEYVIQKKKEEYVVRFELIYMNEQWYYVNKCSIYRDK